MHRSTITIDLRRKRKKIMKSKFIFNNTLVIFILAISLVYLTSCRKKIVSDFKVPQQWDSSYVCLTSVFIEDTSKVYNIFYQIELDESYSFQNLWLFVSILDPTQNLVNDTINFNFQFNRRNKKFLSSLYKNTFIYTSNVKFKKIGEYSFEIKHALRQKSINNIKRIRIILK